MDNRERTRTFHGWPGHLRHHRGVPYNVQLEYSQPLGWISRSADGKFVLHGGDDEEGGFVRPPAAAHTLIPSNHAGARGSIRSDGSGQSSHHHLHLSPSLTTPRSARFHTSSPGLSGSFFAEDLSSVRQPSSVERSFPSTVSSHLTPPFPCSMHFRPIQKAQDSPPPWLLHQQVLGSPLQSSWHNGWPGSRRWLPMQAYPVHTTPRSFPHPAVQPLHHTPASLNHHHRPLATSSPPRLDQQGSGYSTLPGKIPCSRDSSESSSSEHPVTYTRDRLIGAVERVRSAALHRQHASVPELTLETSDHGRVASPSRTSITSGSSGHGSKAASLAHSSLQGELEINNRSCSSSGFASRNHSAFMTSLAPCSGSNRQVPLAGSSACEADSPHSEPTLPVHNYFRQQAVGSVARMHDGGSERGLSDSELYMGLYPMPHRPRKYENTEARCAALKEEFLRFRRRQCERQHSMELESTC